MPFYNVLRYGFIITDAVNLKQYPVVLLLSYGNGSIRAVQYTESLFLFPVVPCGNNTVLYFLRETALLLNTTSISVWCLHP